MNLFMRKKIFSKKFIEPTTLLLYICILKVYPFSQFSNNFSVFKFAQNRDKEVIIHRVSK